MSNLPLSGSTEPSGPATLVLTTRGAEPNNRPFARFAIWRGGQTRTVAGHQAGGDGLTGRPLLTTRASIADPCGQDETACPSLIPLGGDGEPLAREIHRQRRREDEEAREKRQPRLRPKGRLRLVEHVAPARGGRLHADA